MAEQHKRLVSEIHLDRDTRERLLKELEIPGTLDWIPETIFVVRVPQFFGDDVQAHVASQEPSAQIWSLIPQ